MSTTAPIPTFDPTRQRPVMPAHMVLVENACDRPVKFDVGGYPGSPSFEFKLQPGQQAQLPASFLQPIIGANPSVTTPCILAQLASLEPYPGGRQIQVVVEVTKVAETRRAWLRAIKERPRTATVMLHDTEGNPMPIAIPHAVEARREPADDAGDPEDNEIEPPPPDAPDLRDAAPIAAPPATPATKAAGKRHGAKTVGAEG